MYDIIIIGAGPAGLSAALFASRRQQSTLVISKDLGGQAILTDKIYNYPGVEFSAGRPLMQTFKEQAEEYGAAFRFQEVTNVQKEDDHFIVRTPVGEEKAKAVILSFGLTPKDIGVPGEEKFKGETVFCAPTEYIDACKDKNVAIVGGGNSAFDSVLALAPVAKKVYLIHRRDQFRGEEVTLEKIRSFENVEFVLNSQVTEIHGEDELSAVTVKQNQTEEEQRLDVDAVCVNIGYGAKTQWLDELVERDERGHLITNKHCETKTDGLYAAGDVTELPYKQIITSGGEGCKAAMRAYEYLMAKQGKRAVLIDWT